MPEATALLVIDTQVAMFAGPDPAHDTPALLQRIGALLSRARAAGVPVIYVQHCEQEGPFTEGTPTWQIAPEIAPLAGEPVVHKRHCDSFQETTLQEELSRVGARRLVLCGLQTDFCVDTSCRRAYSLGYETILAADCHSTWGDGVLTAEQVIAHHNRVLRSFAKVIPSAEIEF